MNKVPTAILLGIACLCGGAALAWFSSPATMYLTRSGPEAVTVAFESRLFNLFLVDERRIPETRSVFMVDSRTPGSGSDTPPRITFGTAHGPVDLGRVQQLFARDFPDVRGFFEAKTVEPELERERPVEPPNAATISSIGRSSETRRFVIAQSVVLLLTLVGCGVIWMAGRTLLGRDTTIGPH
ncbi:MAG: hypothetical protein ABI818_02580 [Acidobacteriota bacterium]